MFKQQLSSAQGSVCVTNAFVFNAFEINPQPTPTIAGKIHVNQEVGL